jgi:hypothetical protein
VKNAETTLRAGFTTVRDLGSKPFLAVDLRDAIPAGTVVGPRVVASGPIISRTGGHGDVSGFAPAVKTYLYRSERDFGIADGPEELRKLVRTQVKYGVDVIKLCATGGVGLDESTRDLEIYPQRLYNVRVKKPLTDLLEDEHKINACEKALGSSGRVPVRFSGTELLVRVMVEAAEPAQVEEYGQRIARAIEREIGVK